MHDAWATWDPFVQMVMELAHCSVPSQKGLAGLVIPACFRST
jgi:hypothetical protein